MLAALTIRHFVLVDSLHLEFGSGLTVLTGETGAGKSIILDALGLVLGERASQSLVRAGEESAQVVAEFLLGPDHQAWHVLKEYGLEGSFSSHEKGQAGPLILRRSVASSTARQTRSRVFVNDQPAGVGVLKSLGETLVEIHGQFAGQALLKQSTHLRLLDAFANNETEGQKVRAAYEAHARASQDYDALLKEIDKGDEDRLFLEDAVAELEGLDPKADEEEDLAARRNFMKQAEKSQLSLREAYAFLTDERLEASLSSACTMFERAIAALGMEEKGEEQAHECVTQALDASEKALIEVQEARAQCETALEAFDFDEKSLEDVEERLFALRALARKHHVSVTELPDIHLTFTQRLKKLETASDCLEQAQLALEAAKKSYDGAASLLSRARSEAAVRLDQAVLKELPPLKLDKARFRTRLTQSEQGARGPDGQDDVVFEVAPNPGAGFGDLASIASGGELARLSLALKVVLQASSSVSMIFDEVDQGVGGATADAVGRRLKALTYPQQGSALFKQVESPEGGGESRPQILVITHSPQIAVYADQHMQVKKEENPDGKTVTHVKVLSPEEREEELARMLAGESISEEARAAARRLLEVRQGDSV